MGLVLLSLVFLMEIIDIVVLLTTIDPMIARPSVLFNLRQKILGMTIRFDSMDSLVDLK